MRPHGGTVKTVPYSRPIPVGDGERTVNHNDSPVQSPHTRRGRRPRRPAGFYRGWGRPHGGTVKTVPYSRNAGLRTENAKRSKR